MKSKLIIGTILLIVISLFVYQPVKKFIADKRADTNVILDIYKGNNYNAAVYDCTYAQVHIIAEKVGRRKRTVIWDTVISAKQLKQFPNKQQAFKTNLTVSNINPLTEHLEVSYILTYKSDDKTLEMQGQSVVSGKMDQFDIEI